MASRVQRGPADPWVVLAAGSTSQRRPPRDPNWALVAEGVTGRRDRVVRFIRLRQRHPLTQDRSGPLAPTAQRGPPAAEQATASVVFNRALPKSEL